MHSLESVVYYASAALIVRVLGSIVFGWVLYRQIQIYRQNHKDGLGKTRAILTSIVVAAILYNFLTIYNNYIRITEGGVQNQFVNNMTLFLGAAVMLLTSIGFAMFYRKPKS